MRVVLSGPIQADDDFEAHFTQVATILRRAGHSVFSPAEIPNAKFAKTATQEEHQVALRKCISEIAKADIVYMLENWQISRGARFEFFVAVELGIPVQFWGALV